MADFKIKWDEEGKRLYELGVDRGVLYPMDAAGTYTTGEAWNGLTGVDESPSGGEPTALYANNKKYVDFMSSEEFAATIKAYTYPDGFKACQGYKELAEGVLATQQTHQHFGFTYRTKIGNDTEGINHGYRIHIVYNALAKPASRSNSTINASPEGTELSWEISTTPVEINKAGFGSTAHIMIESSLAADKLAKIEDMLYGGEADAKLPTIAELVSILEAV